jgi:hypothetical protein
LLRAAKSDADALLFGVAGFLDVPDLGVSPADAGISARPLGKMVAATRGA